MIDAQKLEKLEHAADQASPGCWTPGRREDADFYSLAYAVIPELVAEIRETRKETE